MTQEWIGYLTGKWWHRRNNNAWHWWINPFSEVRVSRHTSKTKQDYDTYYFSRPIPEAEEILILYGWTDTGCGVWRTNNKQNAIDALEQLDLPLPDCNSNHCYRHYWQETMYYI